MNGVHCFKDRCFEVLYGLDNDSRALFASVIWRIWHSRNALSWDKENHTSMLMCNKATSFLDDWGEARVLRDVGLNLPISDTQFKWSTPPLGHLKCNVGASFSNDNGSVGWGLCIRNDFSEFVAAKTMWNTPCLQVPEGEAPMSYLHYIGSTIWAIVFLLLNLTVK